MTELFLPYLTVVGWVLGPVALGVIWGRMGAPASASRRLFNFSFYGAQTFITLCSLWIARIDKTSVLMPVLSTSGWLMTAGFAWLVSRWLQHPPERRGAFIAAMSQSNNGFTLLGFVALVLFGEAGLAQATYSQAFSAPFLLLFSFPVARSHSHVGGGRGKSFIRVLLDNVLDPRVFLPLTTISCGLALNLLGVARPAVVSTVVRRLIYVGTATSGCAVGLLFRGAQLGRYWRENAISFVYRSSLYPLFYAGLALAFGLHPLDARILILYGLVPSALLANYLAVLFELDTDLTSSVFVVSTVAFLASVLPAYAWLSKLH
ncbi:MAG: AEC family transporter [Myxococcales bacterium]